jgi:hypothetical protein
MAGRTRLRSLLLAVVAMTVLLMTMPAALADPGYEIFDEKDGWICGVEEGLVANHCLNVNSKGKTLVIMVFAPDPRGPQESASTDPKADFRPCPHDDNADPDGTWWNFTGDPENPLFVCHHSGQQQFLP